MKRKDVGPGISKVGVRGRRNEDVLDAHEAWCIWGRIFSSGKLVKTASECKTQFFCSPKNFIKDNIWFCSDQRKNYFQTNPGSLQFICKCFFISNLFKLNDYFQLEIFFQNLKCFDFILEAKLGKFIHSNIFHLRLSTALTLETKALMMESMLLAPALERCCMILIATLYCSFIFK